METGYISYGLYIEGMTCSACESRIESELKKLEGVIQATASYSHGTVLVKYAPDMLGLSSIVKSVESLNYTVVDTDTHKNQQTKDKKFNMASFASVGIIIFAVYWLVESTIGFNFLPEINDNMGLIMLFAAGLLTSVHCISMCGGINLSQSIGYINDSPQPESKIDRLKPGLCYNAGRVISYTAIGGIVGVIGSAVSLPGRASGIVSIAAGAFMILMGINMLNIFMPLRKFIPRIPRFIESKVNKGKTNRGPFVVGLLNGFMPCGPLQTMQIYALGTGSFILGALSMFFFSIGTVPLMFGFGAASTFLSRKFTKKMMKVSAVLVMLLGVVMLNRGFSLSSIDPLGGLIGALHNQISARVLPQGSNGAADGTAIKTQDGVQYVNSTFTGRRYAPITVQAGVPVVWTINVESVNGCNNPMTIREFDMVIDLSIGENIVEFTPVKAGTIPYSCWMGMINSRITVVEDLAGIPAERESFDEAEEDEFAFLDGFFNNFYNSQFVINDVEAAMLVGDVQEITITIENGVLFPNTVVLQEGIDIIVRFNVLDELNPDLFEENLLIFPEYGGIVDLLFEQETPPLPTVIDFGFGDISGNRVFAKLVPDINDFTMDDVIQGVAEYFEN